MAQNKQHHGAGGRIPPQHIDAEKALLGAIMIKPAAMIDVADIIGSEVFYADKHRVIFEAMLELHKKGDPIDILSLSARLENLKQLDRIGGNAYLSELANAVPSASNAEYYAHIVKSKAIKRELIAIADMISELGYADEKEVEEVLDAAEQKVFSVTNAYAKRSFVPISETLTAAWEHYEHLHNDEREFRGVPTGFLDLDRMLSGLQPSDMVILAARPSMGKTTLALDIARQAATQHNVPVAIFSLEMAAQQLVNRMLSAEARIDAWKLRTGKLSGDDDYGRLQDALGRLSQAPIFIDDKPGNTIMGMRSMARQLKMKHNLGLIVIDYMQLITPSRHYENMVNQVTELSHGLKALAREINVPVLVLSQLSRAVESRGGKPRLSDLRDSGSIEQDADVVMFIHRDDKYNENSDKPNIAQILVEKHRNGPTGSVDLYFDGNQTTFLSIDKRAQVDPFESF
ncbi:MAG: replicative DNA helicase [Candidatus Yonathbacteria bacterium]|nr:replicative DNA helicase [Candidatus Yonathbacteria bacterium]